MFLSSGCSTDSSPCCVLAASSTIGPFRPVFPLSETRVSAAQAEQASPPVPPKGHEGIQILLSPGETVHVIKSYSWNATKLPRGGAPSARFTARQSMSDPWRHRDDLQPPSWNLQCPPESLPSFPVGPQNIKPASITPRGWFIFVPSIPNTEPGVDLVAPTSETSPRRKKPSLT